MDYTGLTDLQILAAAERHEIPLLTPQQRYNCIKKIKRREGNCPTVIVVQEGLKWFTWFSSD